MILYTSTIPSVGIFSIISRLPDNLNFISGDTSSREKRPQVDMLSSRRESFILGINEGKESRTTREPFCSSEESFRISVELFRASVESFCTSIKKRCPSLLENAGCVIPNRKRGMSKIAKSGIEIRPRSIVYNSKTFPSMASSVAGKTSTASFNNTPSSL